MDVAISTLRAELSTWIERARSGEEIVVTERGTPVARLLAVDAAPLLDQLIASGVLSKPLRDNRPSARGAARAHASGPVSELVSFGWHFRSIAVGCGGRVGRWEAVAQRDVPEEGRQNRDEGGEQGGPDEDVGGGGRQRL